MYASFNSLSHRETKRKALLRQTEKDLAIRNHLEGRYKDALWSADIQNNRLSMIPTRVTSSTQTDASIPPAAVIDSVTYSSDEDTGNNASRHNSVSDASMTSEVSSKYVFSETDLQEEAHRLQEEAHKEQWRLALFKKQ
ncbi:hypothetical protein PPTG_05626 [Phytophthora nicotianae INRA-310]|uniref:Uncharacterized protein n=1 Tax=Phytophthora nicotianae (strain INRA-310) TaxID=761204 RepID=W2QXY3_PHYN3|nr:hypothetical protein PPTG_05626 [Phytophthora nicotianae INRA-310]ETN17983.1 hypothetical protein PPTG_05626 [Phytophthora nicotianae INRA-310]